MENFQKVVQKLDKTKLNETVATTNNIRNIILRFMNNWIWTTLLKHSGYDFKNLRVAILMYYDFQITLSLLRGIRDVYDFEGLDLS